MASHPVISARFAGAEQIGEVKLHGLPLAAKKGLCPVIIICCTGDAAMLIDPFTGEGIGNAMMSGMFAAQHAKRCIESRGFSAQNLKAYDKDVYDRLWSELLLSTVCSSWSTFRRCSISS